MELQGRFGSVTSLLNGVIFKNPKRKGKKKWREEESVFRGWKRKLKKKRK